MNWNSIMIESNLIEMNTEKAVLINMPKKSKYKGFAFWHPMKLCRLEGKNDFLVKVSFTDNFEFNLKKYGKGKFNFKDVLGEKVISVEEFKKAFGYNTDILDDLKED